jgi:putative transposase
LIRHFKQWATQKGLKSTVIEMIEEIRKGDPLRKVRSGRKNVSGFYPSRKMGVTIQFESHTVELAGIYEYELDEKVIEYYDQPSQFEIEYKGKKRKFKHQYTPDFFVIRNNWIGWEEWKTEKELIELEGKYPDRYFRDVNNIWRSPPAEKYATELGLSFRVRSDQEIIWERLNNIRFLEDYLYHSEFKVPEKEKEIIVNEIKKNPGISLYDLLTMPSKNITSDYVYFLIVTRDICCDLDNYDITDYKRFSLFADELTKEAYTSIKADGTREDMLELEILDLNEGSSIKWGSNIFEIINIDEENIWLMGQSASPKKLSVDVFYELVEKGEIKGNGKGHLTLEEQERREIVSSLNEDDMREVLRKFNIVTEFLISKNYSKFKVPERTLRSWKAKYEEGEMLYNSGFLGLVPQTKKKGNRLPKITEAQKDLMNKAITEHYENNRKRNMLSVYKTYKVWSNNKNIKPATYKTFRKYIRKRPIYQLTLAREGKRAAYKYEEFYWELDVKKTPRHGKRPFEIVHIDHTELDIQLVCSESGKNLGKPWVTFAADAFSRRVLAFYLTFDEPSYRSNMMVLRELVKRFKRMPSTIVVDGGTDFRSIYFDTLLAINKVIKKVRPGAKPRFGAIIERLFGTINTTFINNLLGNTQITKNVRMVTPQVDPKKNAVWTLELLYEAMREFVYEIYDKTHHSTLNNSPREVFDQGLKMSGIRKQTFITDYEVFKMLTLPSTKKKGSGGTAKVQAGGNIQINTFNYWNDILRNPKFVGQNVKVRYDPFDISVAYAYLDKQWVKLDSDYKEVFRGMSEKVRKILSAEIRRRNKLNGINKDITLNDYVDFMETNDGRELIEQQKRKDRASKAIIQAIDGNRNAVDENLNVSNKMTKETEIETGKVIVNGTKVKTQDTGYEQADFRKDKLKDLLKSKEIVGFGRFDYGQ